MARLIHHYRTRLMLVLVLLLSASSVVANQRPQHSATANAAGIGTLSLNKAALANITFTTKIIFDPTKPFAGASIFDKPTVLTFGPDGRLYVGQFDGHIYALTLNASYDVTAVQLYNTIYNTPNFNDDGTPAPTVAGRQLIGLVFDPASTAGAPIMYVSHSDIRYALNNNGGAGVLTDTHSGTVTRLTGPNYDLPASRSDIIKGLPRSRENHSTTSIIFNTTIANDPWLYIAQGSNTNNGAPSNHFSNLPEYYLSAAILRAKVKDPGFGTLDLESVDTAAEVTALSGKFEIYGTGYRNPYDFVWHSNGKLYANVNGGTDGFGDTPGPADGCPTGVDINPGYLNDQLRVVTAGSYGGHPNPARGECTLNDGSQQSLPRPANYVDPLLQYFARPSTNGITEYTATTFDGQMVGNLIVATYGQNQNVSRIVLNAAGTAVQSITTLATFRQPLDVVSNNAGVIFVAEFGGDAITIMRPAIVNNCPPPGAPSDSVDTDDDGYTDKDEVDNGTDQCSPASLPADFDQTNEWGAGNVFKRSDLNDPDDDNDGILDGNDQLYLDYYNGTQTKMPVVFDWNPEDAPLGKVANTGFTGVQITNGVSRTIRPNISVGAAGGFTSLLSHVGTNAGSTNTQANALQIGFDSRRPFKIETRVTEPFIGRIPAGNQAVGLFMGQDQDNYIKLVITANKNGNGNGGKGIQFASEVGGTLTNNPTGNNPTITLPNTGNVDLRLTGNPVTNQVKAYYRIGSNAESAWQLIGTIAAPASYFGASLPAGILSTHAGTTEAISFVLDYFKIEYNDTIARINGGGAAVTTGGAAWSADNPASRIYSTGGEDRTLFGASCPTIANTTDAILYCSERSQPSNNPMVYTIPITTPGTYKVRMHFAEIYHGIGAQPGGTGKRIFDVLMEGQLKLDNYDIIAQTGGAARAITETFDVVISDSALNITFANGVDRAKVSAIEVWGPVLPVSGGGTPTPVTPTVTSTTIPPTVTSTAIPLTATSTAIPPTVTSTAVSPTATSTVAATATTMATATAVTPTTTATTPLPTTTATIPLVRVWLPLIAR